MVFAPQHLMGCPPIRESESFRIATLRLIIFPFQTQIPQNQTPPNYMFERGGVGDINTFCYLESNNWVLGVLLLGVISADHVAQLSETHQQQLPKNKETFGAKCWQNVRKSANSSSPILAKLLKRGKVEEPIFAAQVSSRRHCLSFLVRWFCLLTFVVVVLCAFRILWVWVWFLFVRFGCGESELERRFKSDSTRALTLTCCLCVIWCLCCVDLNECFVVSGFNSMLFFYSTYCFVRARIFDSPGNMNHNQPSSSKAAPYQS